MGGAFKGDRGSLGHITEVECAQIRPPIGRVKCLDAGPISAEKAARQDDPEGYKVLTPRNPRRNFETRTENMVGRLEGKVAIVTGGGHGFGLGIVQKFVKEGAKVVIFDINKELGEKAASANKGCKFVQGDVSLKKDWEKALDTAVKDFGKCDIVVNNAGILIVKVCMLRLDDVNVNS